MFSKKRLSLFLVLAVMVTALVGCGSDDSDTANNDGDGSEIDDEQYIIRVLDSEPSTLDPSKGADDYSTTVLKDVMEPLTRLEEDEDQNTELKPAGAEDWDISEDGLVWTFYLRDNNWSDGEPVTAEQYEYGIKRSANPDTASPFAFLMSPIKNADAVIDGSMEVDDLGVEALDEKTLEITLEKPTPYFDQLTYQRVLFAQREDIVEEHGEAYGSEAENLIFNGPFVVSEWVHNSEVVLHENPEYWDAESVNFEEVTFQIMTDRNSIYNSLSNGSIDSASVADPDWLERFSEDEDLEHLEVVQPAVNFILFNTNNELFENENIRKAFSLGINREEIVEVIFNGINEPANGWVPPTIMIGEEDYREEVEEPLIAIAEENPDPRELLEKGLEEIGMDKEIEDLDVTFSLGNTDQWYRTLGEYIQQMYKESLGLEVEIEQLEWPIFASNVNKGDFQIGYMAWTADFNDPATMMTLLTSDSTAIKTGWENERYDELVNMADEERDHAKRLEYYKEAEQIVLEEAPVSPVVFSKSNVFRYKYINNMGVTEFGTQGSKYGFTQGR